MTMKHLGRPRNFQFHPKCDIDPIIFEHLGNSDDIPPEVSKRALILFLSIFGVPYSTIVSRLGEFGIHTTMYQVTFWQREYMKKGSNCVWEYPVSDMRDSVDFLRKTRDAAFYDSPPRGGKWTVTDLACRMEVSRSYFYKILKSHDLHLADPVSVWDEAIRCMQKKKKKHKEGGADEQRAKLPCMFCARYIDRDELSPRAREKIISCYGTLVGRKWVLPVN
jgi:hypothetical protein